MSAPFYGSIIVGLIRKADPGCRTMWVDGVHLGYEPEFVNELTPGNDLRTADFSKLTTVLAHEAGHIAAMHHLRLEGRDPELANKAADYVVNGLLSKEVTKSWRGTPVPTFKLPDDALLSSRFDGMAFEEVYNILKRERSQKSGSSRQPQPNQSSGSGNNGSGAGQPPQPKPQQQGQQKSPSSNFGKGPVEDSTNQGAVRPFPSPSGEVKATAQELRKEEQSQIMRNVLAMDAAKMCGAGSIAGERLLAEQKESKVDWREVLSRFTDDAINRVDYSYSRPDRRRSGGDFIFPSICKPDTARIVLCVDTSGSIDSNTLNLIASAMLSYVESFSGSVEDVAVPVVYCDSEVAGTETLTPGNKLTPKGGGGTAYSPALKYVDDKLAESDGAKAIVYFTDGYCYDFHYTPKLPVLWMLSGKSHNANFKPPFGEVVVVSE